MIDNTKARTGYDLELLLASGYFLAIIKAALATGQIQPIRFPDIRGPWSFELLDVTQVQINDEDKENKEEDNRVRVCRSASTSG